MVVNVFGPCVDSVNVISKQFYLLLIQLVLILQIFVKSLYLYHLFVEVINRFLKNLNLLIFIVDLLLLS